MNIVDTWVDGNGNHDTVVMIASQLPALSNFLEREALTQFDSRTLLPKEDIVHTVIEKTDWAPESVGAPDAPVIRKKILTLLAESSSLHFTKPSTNVVVASGASTHPLPLRTPSALEPTAAATVATIGTLDILQPAPGTRVPPGEQILIQAAAPVDSRRWLPLCS